MCLPKEQQQQRVETSVGVFEQSVVRRSASRVVVERSTEVHQRWIEPESFAALEDLALAEYRAQRRRIRMQCDAADEAAAK